MNKIKDVLIKEQFSDEIEVLFYDNLHNKFCHIVYINNFA